MILLTTVSQVLDWFGGHDTGTMSKERARLRGMFRDRFGAELLTECAPAQLIEFIGGLSGAKSNHTKKRIRATVCRPFNEAVRVGLILRNPFQGVKFKRGKRGRMWSKEEFQTALRHSSAHFRRLMMFIRFSGARPGEIRNMTYQQVRADMGVIVQAQHKTSWDTDDPRRIHLNHVTAKLLGWLLRHKQNADHPLVNAEGGAWTIGSLTKYMRAVRRRANLPSDLKLHGLRHTFATTALTNGVDIKTLADLLGHATTRTTEIYLHAVDQRGWMNKAANRAIGRNDAN